MSTIHTEKAPKPVGAYPHARRVGNLLYLSGVGSRVPGSDEIPKGIEAQTQQVVANVKAVLEAAGSSLAQVVDVQVFLTNMQQDFPGFNKVYAEHFRDIQATRTTIEVGALPTPIAVEFKVIAEHA